MLRLLRIPIVVNIAFFAVALSPASLLGCRTRGLLAVAIALASGLGAIAAALVALKGRVKGEAGADRWTVATLVLTVPVAAFTALA